MVLVERPCLKCGATCEAAVQVCPACGASLKTTLPLNENVGTLATLRLAHHLQANSLFKARYRIIRLVGVGGFGAVYEAQDMLEHRQVAIKEIGLIGLTSQEMIEVTGSFNREAQLLSSLQHPSIPGIYAQLTDTEHWYLVMDFIAGQTLEEKLAQADGGSLAPEECLRIAVQLCDVLEYLHNSQPVVIFRDLKPANIMLTNDGRLYLIDFGVARLYKPGQPRDTIAFGSPGYAAPEQYGRVQTTPRTDIYSLGVLLHQMLTGQDPSLNPFRFQPLSVGGHLPARLEQLVAQMLEKDMEHRPESASEVRRQLQAILKLSAAATRHKKVSQVHRSSLTQTPGLANPFSTMGVTVSIYRRHTEAVHILAWSPDGRSLISCDNGNYVFIWNAFQQAAFLAFPFIVGGQVHDLAWSPDGSMLATAGEDGAVRLWRTHLRLWQKVAYFFRGLPASSASKDPPYTRSWSSDEQICLWEQKGSVHALSWSPDGQMFVSAQKSALHIWNAQTKEHLLLGKGHSGVVDDVAWSPDGQRIASCGRDHTTRIWSASDGKILWHWRAKGGTTMTVLAWSPNGHYLACGADNGTIHVWDTLQERQIYIYQAHKDWISSVVWSPDGQRIASASFDQTVHVWSALDGKDRFIYRSHEDKVLALAWSPDGQYLASAGSDQTVHVWKAT